MKKIRFNEIAGFQTGQMSDLENGTGVTVILAPEGATAGVDVRGGGPATRETDLLDPKNMVQQINAVVLSGGSAYGLEASSGVMQYCREKGIGFGLGEHIVPIVCQASLFDLNCGNPKAFPDKVMGYKAAQASEDNEITSGCYGAGTGASVGKALGFENAMKSGIGTCAYEIGPLQVGAVVAVNACGDVYYPNSDKRIAGIYNSECGMEIETEDVLLSMAGKMMEEAGANTTIGCIITNADLDKSQMNKLASMAQNALARTIRPVHTPNDGDTVFTMTTNQIPADLTLVSIMAVKALEQAIVDALLSAKEMYGLPSHDSVKAAKEEKARQEKEKQTRK